MIKFIEVFNQSGDVYLINIDHIVAILKDDDGKGIIYTAGNFPDSPLIITSDNTVDELKEKIREAT